MMANPRRNRGYRDLKYKFIRGLIKHEHKQRRHQFLKQAAEWTSKAIVSLSHTEQPIRTAKQATQLDGIGAVISASLTKIQKEIHPSSEPPLPGRHLSTGAGLLVALLNESEALGSSEGGRPLVGEAELRQACESICEEKFNTVEPSADGSPVMCPAWWRINVLISRGYVKKRTRGRHPVYELLPEGEEIARRLRGPHLITSAPLDTLGTHIPPPCTRPPTPPGGGSAAGNRSSAKRIPLKSNSATKGAANTGDYSSQDVATSHYGPLYSTDTGGDGVVMLVDSHELGGDRVRLGELSRRLKEWDVPHKTCGLACGDYQWVWRQQGQEVTLPILVERKRADDLAESMKDGRFISQKDRMVNWRAEFGILSDEVSLQYIVESSPAAYRVACMDGCNGVGKCGNPSVEQVEVAIGELKSNPDFVLVQTTNIEVTVEYLATLTADLKRRVSRGDFEVVRLLHKSPAATHESNMRGTRAKRATTTSTNSCSSTHTRGNDYFHQGSKSSRIGSWQSSTASICSFDDSVAKDSVRSPTAVVRASSVRSDGNCMSPTAKQFRGTSTASSGKPSSGFGSCSSTGNRKRRPYLAIDIDDILEEDVKKPRMGSNVVVSLDDEFADSQDDYLLSASPFGDSSSAGDLERKIQSGTRASPTRRTDFDSFKVTKNELNLLDEEEYEETNNKGSKRQRRRFTCATTTLGGGSNVDQPGGVKNSRNSQVFADEDKISAVREVMPDSSIEAVINALSSAEGNVDGAVMKLLEGPQTLPSTREPERGQREEECIDLT